MVRYLRNPFLMLLGRMILVFSLTMQTSIAANLGLGKTPAIALVQNDDDYLIKVKIQPIKLMLGEHVTLTIRGESLGESFEKIDWSAFEEHFVLYETDIDSDRIRIKMYPINAGKFTIKGQHAGLINLPDSHILVTSNEAVSIEWQRPNTQLYTHQSSLWQAKVWVKDVANKITYEARGNQVNQTVNISLEALPVVTNLGLISSLSGKTEKLVASYQVKGILPSNSENRHLIKAVLHSPIVVVKNTTNRRWFFFDHPLKVELLQLPRFLPPTVAVGNLSWQSITLPSIQTVGKLQYWIWNISGFGVNQAFMNSIAHQLLADIPYSPSIEWLSDSQEISTKLSANGLQSQLLLRLPYRITQSGLVNFPALRLRFFNPKTTKLETFLQPESLVLAVPVFIVWFVQWMTLLIGLLFTFGLLWQFKQIWLNWQLKRAIGQANNLAELWQAIIFWRDNQTRIWFTTGFSLQQYIDNLLTTQTLAQWQQWYRTNFGESLAFDDLISVLNQSFYHKDAIFEETTLQQNGDVSESERTWQSVQLAALSWCASLGGLSLIRHKFLSLKKWIGRITFKN